MSERVPITPATRVGELLEAYPQLEEELIRLAPAFQALRNPILRRTVARVATLERAAQVGGLPVRDLVAALRKAAGLGAELPLAGAQAAAAEAGGPPGARPAWAREELVRVTLDAEALLAAGEVPLPRVQRALQEIEVGSLVKVVSRFRPAPLLEAVERGGHRTCVLEPAPGTFHTYVARAR
jgi:hypothetical protein